MALPTTTYTIPVDFTKQTRYAPIRFVKGDKDTCKLAFTMAQVVTGLTCYVSFITPDKENYVLEAMVAGANSITLTLPTGVLAVRGNVHAQIALYSGTSRITHPVAFTFTVVDDFSELAIAPSDHYPILTELIEDCEAIEAAELLRVAAEDDRVIAEGLRDTAEGLRDTAEGLRDAAEGLRDTAEGMRVIADGDRDTAEGLRDTAEGLRVIAESDRDTAEGLRDTAEGLRDTAEGLRDTAEGERDAAEIIRLASEGDASSGRVKAEADRVIAENARVAAEGNAVSGRVKAEADRVTAEGLRVLAENARATGIGTQTYTEDNYVTDGESNTVSIDKLDMAVKDRADAITTLNAEIKFPTTNTITNGDYSNAVTGWTATNANLISATDNELIFIATAQNGRYGQTVSLTSGYKYYMCGWVKSTSNLVRLDLGSIPIKSHSGSGSYEFLSNVMTAASTYMLTLSARDARASGWDNVSQKYMLSINLTSTFGLGKEPTVTEMDNLMLNYTNKWFNGTQNILWTTYLMAKINYLQTQISAL